MLLTPSYKDRGYATLWKLCLVDAVIADEVLPNLDAAHTQLKGYDFTRARIDVVPVTEADHDTEYLANILNIK